MSNTFLYVFCMFISMFFLSSKCTEHEAGHCSGPVPGSLQPHGHVQGALQETGVMERRSTYEEYLRWKDGCIKININNNLIVNPQIKCLLV